MSLNKVNTFADEVKNMIYRLIQEEMTVDEFDEMTDNEFEKTVQWLKHEVLDDEINIMYIGILDELLCEYGVQKAYKSYMDEYGIDCEMPTSRCVLYHIINDMINLSFGDYKKWCWDNDESDDESDDEDADCYKPTTISNKVL